MARRSTRAPCTSAARALEMPAQVMSAAAMRALCVRLKDQAPILPVCFKSTSVLTKAGVVEGLAPTATEPFYALGQCAVHLEGKSK